MIGLGFGLFFGGYWLSAYAWGQLRSCNAGFVSLGWPGSYKGCNADSGSTPSTTPAPTNPSISSKGVVSTGTNPLQAKPGGGLPIDYNKGSGVVGGVV